MSAARATAMRARRRRTRVQGDPCRLREQGRRTSADRILTPVPGRCLRGFLALSLVLGALAAAPGVLAQDDAAARSRGSSRQRHQPRHAGVRRERRRPGGGGRLRGDGARPRHAGRARLVDARDREALPRVGGSRRRLRRSSGLERGLGRRRDRDGGRHRGDGAADEHRLVDARSRSAARTSRRTSGGRSSTTPPRTSASSRASTTATSSRLAKMVTEGVELRRARGEGDRARRGRSRRRFPRCSNEIDGMKTVPKGLVLETAGAQIEDVEMSFWQRARDFLVDPNLIALDALDRPHRDRRRALEPRPRSSRERSGRSRSSSASTACRCSPSRSPGSS